ncbi:hypothetical protein [Streptomyces sp. NPDC057238]|uniref:hypothetical protein n=1 Tax=Streptomyces sp. NPDC057238 TaxID=3346060 RepID=UPI0036384820
MAKDGLRVTVEGDLPAKTMERIADAVRQTVLDEVAGLDLAPPLREVAPGAAGSSVGSTTGEPGDALSALPFLGIILRREK